MANRPIWAGEGAAQAGQGGRLWLQASGRRGPGESDEGGRNRSGNPLGQGLLSGSHSCSHLPLSLSLPSSHFLFPLPHLPQSNYLQGRKMPTFSSGTCWGVLAHPSLSLSHTHHKYSLPLVHISQSLASTGRMGCLQRRQLCGPFPSHLRVKGVFPHPSEPSYLADI